ncbi:MAG: glycosyltransferase family 9 protein [Leptospiraceae bacterium]|nr:glycosyltransferase family 9 protein [Leptospiraceae bacterium]MCP5497845.1 glycosyltransferase family 9 protein [Leptospiraceae bacterium]
MNILVMRFSAMGDVALLTPVLVAIASKHPNLQIILATRGNYSPFFYNIPNVHVIGYNLKKYKGLSGMWKLYKEISVFGPFDKIIDLHASLRSKIFGYLFRIKKVPVFTIIKGRRDKRKQTRRRRKILTKLPHTVDRYLKVFEKAGFSANIRKGSWINVDLESKIYAKNYFKSIGIIKKDKLWIGFAPFAGHKLKEWPIYKSEKLIELILKEFDSALFLIGSTDEMTLIKKTVDTDDLPNCYIVNGGNYGLRGELGIMEKLDLIIGMDSSNLHIAALMNKPVIGIYGTTHPYSGFGPYMQEDLGVLQIDNLSCRPCSIYGNTTCYRKDFACMELIDPVDVIQRIKLILKKK